MNKKIRIFIIVLLVIASSALVFIIYTNLNTKFNGQNETRYLAEKFPLVITTDNTTEFFTIAEAYGNVTRILPFNNIMLTKKAVNIIAPSVNKTNPGTWVCTDLLQPHPIFITRMNRAVKLAVENNTQLLETISDSLNSNRKIFRISIDQQPVFYTTVKDFILVSVDAGNLNHAVTSLETKAVHPFPTTILSTVNAYSLHRVFLNQKLLSASAIQIKNDPFPIFFPNAIGGIFELQTSGKNLFINGFMALDTIISAPEKIAPLNVLVPKLKEGSTTVSPLHSAYFMEGVSLTTQITGNKLFVGMEIGTGISNNSNFSEPKATNYSTTDNQFFQLDAPIKRGPVVITNNRIEEELIYAFDLNNTLYCFNNNGTIVWKKSFTDPIIGDLSQVDKNNEGNIQIMWNSKTQLHLINAKGDEMPGYPHTFLKEAVGSVSVLDYKSNGNYRILYVDIDGIIHNLDISPAPVIGWKNPKISFPFNGQAQWLKYKNEYYIVFAGTNGEAALIGITGDIRMRIKKSFVNNPSSAFYLNTTNEKGFLITTDEIGKLTYIPQMGKVAKTDFGTFSKNHFFFYEDFDGNGNNDFLYVDGNQITIFNRFKRIINKTTINGDINEKPVIYKVNNEVIIGVTDSKNSILRVFNKNGERTKNQEIPCEGKPVVTFSSKTYTIYSSLGSTIYKTELITQDQ